MDINTLKARLKAKEANLDTLKELNMLVARANRHLKDYDTSGQASDYWQYHEIWVQLRDEYGMTLPAFLGRKPLAAT